MKTFEEIYEIRTLGNYEGICDHCGAPIVIKDKFWAVLIGKDENWDYHMLINFFTYCFVCKGKGYFLKTNNHPFDVTKELASLRVNHANV